MIEGLQLDKQWIPMLIPSKTMNRYKQDLVWGVITVWPSLKIVHCQEQVIKILRMRMITLIKMMKDVHHNLLMFNQILRLRMKSAHHKEQVALSNYTKIHKLNKVLLRAMFQLQLWTHQRNTSLSRQSEFKKMKNDKWTQFTQPSNLD